MTPAHASDAFFTKYKTDTAEKRLQTVYDIMASLEAAHRTDDTPKYNYFLGISQEINNWHRKKNHNFIA